MYSYAPSWNLCSSSEMLSSLPMPSSSNSNTLPIFSSPQTPRRTPSEGRPSLISDRSPWPPALSEQASTYSLDCENRDAIPPLLSSTIQPPKASTLSVPRALSPPSGQNASEWGQIDSDLPRRILGCTLLTLAETWPRTSPTSQIVPSWPLGCGAR